MKHASILLLAIGLCGLSFAACAEGDDSTFGNTPSDGKGGDNGEGGSKGTGGQGGQGGKPTTTSSTTTSGASSGGSEVCSIACSSDTDCTNGCPVPKVGINCCASNTCYISAEAVCPSSQTGSSSGMYP